MNKMECLNRNYRVKQFLGVAFILILLLFVLQGDDTVKQPLKKHLPAQSVDIFDQYLRKHISFNNIFLETKITLSLKESLFLFK